MRTVPPSKQRQRGAAFIVMLVIMIMGVTIYLVSALSKVALQTARNEKSSDMLAQAKEVLIGYAMNGSGVGQRPGMLPYPDRLLLTEVPPNNYDGNQNNCPTFQPANLPSGCMGRLPWRTLGLSLGSPSENDPTGVMPWYAVSANLVDPAVPLNSELLNSAPHTWLTVHDMNGNVLSNRVAFVIIIPGAILPGQSRPTSPNLGGINQYLDNITVPACAAPCVPGTYNNAAPNDDYIMGEEHRWIDDPANPGKQTDDPNYNFNDKLLFVTIDELMPLIEKRIAREVKTCLDDYAAYTTNTNHKYPWAASVDDSTAYPNRIGTYNVLFGRVSDIPGNATSSGGPLTGSQLVLQNQIINLQTALANYISGTGTLSHLKNTGDTLKDLALNSPYNLPITDPTVLAGLYADNWNGSSSITTLTGYINSALDALSPSDNTLPDSWAAITSCNNLILNSNYWTDWRDLIFYQVADSFQPGGTGACVSCLSISGSGNTNSGSGSYRAVVIVAGKKLGAQTRTNPHPYAIPPIDYLANGTSEISVDPLFVPNAHNNTSLTTTFITYKPSDPYYQSINDLVLCLDGKGINVNSHCN